MSFPENSPQATLYLQEELLNQRSLVSSLSHQIQLLSDRLAAVNQQKSDLLSALIEQKSAFEDEIISLRKRILETPTPQVAESAGGGESEISRLRAENAKLQEDLAVAKTLVEQSRQYERLIETQQREIRLLGAKVEAFDFVRADYQRLSEEFQAKCRVADSLARNLSAYTAPPPVSIELLNFQQKISERLSVFTDSVTRLFGWRIRELTVGGFLLSRGDMEIAVSDDFRLTHVKHGPELLPENAEIAHLIAVMTLTSQSNR